MHDAAVAVLGAYGGGWQAKLDIGMTRVAGRTVASHVSHAGPLRMQKVLWPEGPELAHLILLHPPSGLNYPAKKSPMRFSWKCAPAAVGDRTAP